MNARIQPDAYVSNAAAQLVELNKSFKREPYAQLDAALMIDAEEIPLTLNIYGEPVRAFRGNRDTPEEFGGLEISDVTVGDGDSERSIYAALSEDDIEILALKVEE